MLKVNDKTIIYVACPAFNKTGGTELAHQLVYEINRQGKKAIIVYYDYQSGGENVNPAFKIYVNKYATLKDIVDDENNVFIVPEIKIDLLDKYHHIKKCVWWMSVDNFVKRNGFFNAASFYGVNNAIKHCIKGRITFTKKKIPKNATHFYQSEYAKEYLLKNGIEKSFRLSDFINQSYLIQECQLNNKRENNVLYNPKKGIEFTRKLIDSAKDLNWIPLQNMTTEEVRNILQKSKVYIDFGNHPGKDRFPREAAISGCCVITGLRGSAKFYEDIPIGQEFKFKDDDSNIDNVIEKIRECINNYDEQYPKFQKYREFIREEYNIFQKDVSKIIE